MNTKLTLRMDDALIQKMKRYSAKSGKSVSQLVADYFALIDEQPGENELTPWVRSLVGVIAGSKLTEADYRKHLQEKYR
jgi:hypothetical protein